MFDMQIVWSIFDNARYFNGCFYLVVCVWSPWLWQTFNLSLSLRLLTTVGCEPWQMRIYRNVQYEQERVRGPRVPKSKRRELFKLSAESTQNKWNNYYKLLFYHCHQKLLQRVCRCILYFPVTVPYCLSLLRFISTTPWLKCSDCDVMQERQPTYCRALTCSFLELNRI
jgi:hypothetical protein